MLGLALRSARFAFASALHHHSGTILKQTTTTMGEGERKSRASKVEHTSSSDRRDKKRGVRRSASSMEKKNSGHDAATAEASRGVRRSCSEDVCDRKERPERRRPHDIKSSDHSKLLTSLHSNASGSQARRTLKSKFDIDAPRKPVPRTASSDAITIASRDDGLTPEQRAWKGIDDILDDNESIATYDVLPEEIVKALSISSSTLPNFAKSPVRRGGKKATFREEMQGDDLPELMNSSFSSLMSDNTAGTKQSLLSYVSAKNFVVQGEDAGDPMKQFLGNLAGAVLPTPGSAKKDTASSMREMFDWSGHKEEQRPRPVVRKSSSIQEEDEDDESDDASADARRMISQYTAGKESSDLPQLLNSSFSSLQSDATGPSLASVLSSAKNYVIQDTSSENPMAAFLGSITQSLEGGKAAAFEQQLSQVMQSVKPRVPSADELSYSFPPQTRAKKSAGVDEPSFVPKKKSVTRKSRAPVPTAEDLSVYEQQRPSKEEETEEESETFDEDDVPQGPPVDPMAAFMVGIAKILQEKSQAPLTHAYDPQDEEYYEDEDGYELDDGNSDFRKEESSLPSLTSVRDSEVSSSHHESQPRSEWAAFGELPGDFAGEGQPSEPMRRKVRKVKKKIVKKRPKTPSPTKKKAVPKPTSVEDIPKPDDAFNDYFNTSVRDDEVISMSPLSSRNKVSAENFLNYDMPTPKASNKETVGGAARKKKYKETGLKSLKDKMSKISLFSKGRRGSPASVVDSGRGEAQFFPSDQDEEEEEGWGSLL